jgi:hypothetical protein
VTIDPLIKPCNSQASSSSNAVPKSIDPTVFLHKNNNQSDPFLFDTSSWGLSLGAATSKPRLAISQAGQRQLPSAAAASLPTFATRHRSPLQSARPASRVASAQQSSIADSSTRAVRDSRFPPCPLEDSRVAPQPAQIAANLQMFLFCPASVRLNAQKSCGFSLFQSDMPRFVPLEPAPVCVRRRVPRRPAPRARPSLSSFQHGHFASNQCIASFFF